jgi:hypothetical protein
LQKTNVIAVDKKEVLIKDVQGLQQLAKGTE